MGNSLGKVAVLCGGRSTEREISLLSGQQVLQALQKVQVDAIAFDPEQRPLSDLSALKVDRVFIALHGRYGEDGAAQGALDMLNIPYTGSGCMASALAMDKYRTKLVWQALGLPTAQMVKMDEHTKPEALVKALGLPLIIKPNSGGSTIGLTKVTDVSQIENAYQKAVALDDTVLAEAFIDGPEYTASILDGKPLSLVKIEAPEGNYDYHNKYFSDDTKYLCPCGLASDVEARYQAICLAAFNAVGCRGWGRVDFMLDSAGSIQLLEVNTSPGMTEHSLMPMAARVAGISFTELILSLLEKAHVG